MSRNPRNIFRNFCHSPRVQLAILAVSTAALTSAAGLTAYLTDVTDPLSSTFEMKLGSDLSIAISSDSYTEDSLITPDEAAAYDPKISNDGHYDAYVFIEVTLPAEDFHLQDISSDWYALPSDAGSDTVVYAYGSDKAMTALPAAARDESGAAIPAETPPLCSAIGIDPDTNLEQGSYTVEATGYAIQTDGLTTTDPAKVWSELKGDAS